jgi:hypothetical protein
MPHKTIHSIEGFVRWVAEIMSQFTTESGYEQPWFRGVGDSGYQLTPGLYRTEEGRDRLADDEIRGEFIRKALPLVGDRTPTNDWEWYFLMQHYRAPTRLLDWTDAALVALYFALTSWSPQSSKHGRIARPAVWALNPFKLNGGPPVGPPWIGATNYLPAPYSESEVPQKPIAIDPSFTAQRMLVQHSHFTLHGRDFRSLNNVRQELHLERDLIQLVVDCDEDGIDYLKQQLTILGVTETAIFPDLEGLARELRFEYGLDKTRPMAS